MKFEQEDELLSLGKEQYLGFYTKVIPTTIMTVAIDEPIKGPAYYRQVVASIDDLCKGDEVIFDITSPGGRLDGLEVILSALRRTEANTIAQISGDCHSAASILALNCNEISVSPYSNMLVHFLSFGSTGPSNHVQKQVAFVKKISEKLFRETYQFFLSDEEITKCIEEDYQLWLDSTQIIERLEHRSEMFQKLYLQQDDSMEEQVCNNCSWCDGKGSCSDEFEEFLPETKDKPKRKKRSKLPLTNVKI